MVKDLLGPVPVTGDTGNRPAIAAVRAGNPRSSGYERAADSWYVELPLDVDVLLDVETFPGVSLDPCCGAGNIPERMSARGLTCFGSDKVYRGYGLYRGCDKRGMDFLADDYPSTAMGHEIANIITNPPFELAEQIVERAMTIVTNKVVILHRLAWLEGKRRREMFERLGLTRVWVFSNRVSMPPGGTDEKPRGGAVAMGWFVFCKGHRGPWQGGFLDSTGRTR